MKLFRSFIVLFLFAFFGCGALIINYIVFPYISLFVKEEEKRKAYCNVIHTTWKFFCTMMQKAGTIKVELTNPEKIKNLKGKIIVANHPSYIDIVLLIGSVPNTICVAKKELKKNIFMGNIVKSLYLINDEESEKMLKNTDEIHKEGYNIVIFSVGLGEIPKDYYEAAEIDGANAVQSFFKITVPLISPTMFFVVVTRVIASLQVFDSIFMMIDRSSPALTKTQSLVYLFYRYAFIENNKGYGSAIVVLLLCVIMVITVFQMYAQKKWVHYE